MIYRICMSPMPILREIYEIERCTYWQCADTRNILLYIVSGSCKILSLGRTYILREKQVMVIPAGQEYKRLPENDLMCRMLYVHFDTAYPIVDNSLPSIVPVSSFELFSSVNEVTDLGERADEFHNMLKELKKKLYDYDSLKRLYQSNCLCTAFFTVISAGQGDNAIEKQPSRHYPVHLRTALTYIQQHYHEPLSCEKLSEICNISPQHMIRLFRKYLGTTPTAYINHYKIMHAIELLRVTELTMKEIAYSLGYESPEYFSSLFKKIMGVSPKVHRNQILHNMY